MIRVRTSACCHFFGLWLCHQFWSSQTPPVDVHEMYWEEGDRVQALCPGVSCVDLRTVPAVLEIARMNKDGSELAIRRANKTGTHHRLLLCMEQTKTTSLSSIPHIFLDRCGGSVRFSWEDKFLTITFSICISGLVMKTSAVRTCQIIAKMPALHRTCCGDHHPLSIFLPAPPHPNLRLGVVAGRGSLG